MSSPLGPAGETRLGTGPSAGTGRGLRGGIATRPLVVAAVSLLLAAASYVLALGVGAVGRIDRELRFPQIVGDWRWRDEASADFSQATLIAFVVLAVSVGILALLRGPRRLMAAAGIMAAGPLLAWALAWALAAIDPLGGETARASQGAFPSGHAAVAMSLGLALVVALPAPLRPIGGILSVAFAGTVSVGILALGWHYPSDLVGAYFASLAGAALVLAVLPAPRRPVRVSSVIVLVAGSVVLCALLGAGALQLFPDEAPSAFIDAHPRFIACAIGLGIVGIACNVAVGMLVGMSRLSGASRNSGMVDDGRASGILLPAKGKA